MRSQEDILNFMKSPFIAFETDSSIHDVEGFGKTEYCHPREFGTYPKILGEFVREKKILPWEDAIRKMTSLPAQILGIHDRGLIYPGAWADVVLFDPTTIIDTATYQNPYQFPLGIKKVMVNGHLVSVSGKHQNLFPGQVLQRN